MTFNMLYFYAVLPVAAFAVALTEARCEDAIGWLIGLPIALAAGVLCLWGGWKADTKLFDRFHADRNAVVQWLFVLGGVVWLALCGILGGWLIGWVTFLRHS